MLRNSFIILMLVLFGCSTAPTIIEVPYPVFIPAIHDTIELVQDTVYLPSDSNAYWEGDVQDSLKNVIGWLKVFYNRQIAELKLNPRTDSIIIYDTIPAIPKENTVQVISGLLDWWGEILLLLFAVILLALQNKNINLISYLKNLIVKK